MVFHPDKNLNDPSAEENMKLLNKAKEILTNKSSREAVDDDLEECAVDLVNGLALTCEFRLSDILRSYLEEQANQFNQFDF